MVAMFTLEQLQAMENAAAKGILEVRVGDKLIRYQTLTELLNAIKLARSDLNLVVSKPTRIYMQYERG